MNKFTVFIQLLKEYDSERRINISEWANDQKSEDKALKELHEEIMEWIKKYVELKE